MTRRLNVLYKCISFFEISLPLSSYRQTGFCEGQTERRMQGENNMSPERKGGGGGGGGGGGRRHNYHNNPKLSDRWFLANSADPDQTALREVL